MSTIRLIYIILHILEIWLLFVAGKKMSKTTTNREYGENLYGLSFHMYLFLDFGLDIILIGIIIVKHMSSIK